MIKVNDLVRVNYTDYGHKNPHSWGLYRIICADKEKETISTECVSCMDGRALFGQYVEWERGRLEVVGQVFKNLPLSDRDSKRENYRNEYNLHNVNIQSITYGDRLIKVGDIVKIELLRPGGEAPIIGLCEILAFTLWWIYDDDFGVSVRLLEDVPHPKYPYKKGYTHHFCLSRIVFEDNNQIKI